MENNQEKAKQHLEGELALFENYLLIFMNVTTQKYQNIFHKMCKKAQVCLF